MPTKITRSARPAPKPHKPKFPIRSPAMAKAADAPNVYRLQAGAPRIPDDAVIYPEWVGWAIRGAKYPAAILLFLIFAWVGLALHRTLALAEVGEITCSAENSMMWIRPTPDSDVPVLNDAVLKACAKAYNPLG